MPDHIAQNLDTGADGGNSQDLTTTRLAPWPCTARTFLVGPPSQGSQSARPRRLAGIAISDHTTSDGGETCISSLACRGLNAEGVESKR